MAQLLRTLGSKLSTTTKLHPAAALRRLSTKSFFESDEFSMPPNAFKFEPSGRERSLNEYAVQGPVDSMEAWIEEDGSQACRFDVPGLPKENVKLDVEANRVYWEGQALIHPTEEKGRFFRTMLTLNPVHFDCAGVRAELVNGVLYLRIPQRSDDY